MWYGSCHSALPHPLFAQSQREALIVGKVPPSQVYKALRHGTSEVAVKHIPCIVGDPQKLHQMRREVAIMQRISYDPNIVQFYGACMTNEGAWLCMEYMEVRTSACGTHILYHCRILTF